MNHLPENELIALLKDGDHHAYEHLFNRYWKMAFAIAYRKCGDEDEALDIVQDIFFQLWENRRKLSVTGSFAAWLTTVVKYKVIDWYRTTKSREAQKELLLKHLQAQAPVVKEAGHISYQELQQDWQAAVDSLPVRMKEVYLMSNEANLSVAQISRKLSLKPQSVKNQLHKAKERLRKMLEHHLITIW